MKAAALDLPKGGDRVAAPGESGNAARRPAGVLAALSSGVALADPGSGAVAYENDRFREWFPPVDAGDGELWRRLPGSDPERARARLGKGRSYRLETEVATGPRPFGVQVEVRPQTLGATPLLLVEAQNISRQKEAEYMLDSYSRLVERKTRELEKEKERVEKLLLNIMPRSVYEELRDFGTTTPQSFESASILMLDFAGFTEMAISRDPGALIAELNDVFTSFDRIIEHFHCERLKTIGDAYMAVAGVPEADPEHAVHLARAALRMRRFLERRNGTSPNRWRSRIGIGSGPVIGSIVGIQKYVYDVFGPAVNLASRLESECEPNQILVCAETAERIRDEFILQPMGRVDLKGFGAQEVFALRDEARSGR